MQTGGTRLELESKRGAAMAVLAGCAAGVCALLVLACSPSSPAPNSADAPFASAAPTAPSGSSAPSEPAAARTSPAKSAAAKAPRQAPQPSVDTDTDADFVSAVGASASNQPLSVKFRLTARPVLGVPVQILISVAPVQDVQVNHVQGAFLPDAGLQLQSERTFEQDEVHSTLRRTVTVVPQQPGVLNLNATFTLEVDNHSVSCSYAIPLIVGDNST